MCFAPPRRALFRPLNFKKCSEPGVFCAFWLRNLLRATTACTFSTSQLQKVLRTWCVLHILTSKCASRHNGMQFFSSHLATWLRTSALASLLFDPPEPQIIGTTQCFATLLPLRAPASSFFSLFLFSDLLASALLFSDSSHLCFSICPYCWEVWLLNFLRRYNYTRADGEGKCFRRGFWNARCPVMLTPYRF